MWVGGQTASQCFTHTTIIPSPRDDKAGRAQWCAAQCAQPSLHHQNSQIEHIWIEFTGPGCKIHKCVAMHRGTRFATWPRKEKVINFTNWLKHRSLHCLSAWFLFALPAPHIPPTPQNYCLTPAAAPCREPCGIARPPFLPCELVHGVT